MLFLGYMTEVAVQAEKVMGSFTFDSVILGDIFISRKNVLKCLGTLD